MLYLHTGVLLYPHTTDCTAQCVQHTAMPHCRTTKWLLHSHHHCISLTVYHNALHCPQNLMQWPTLTTQCCNANHIPIVLGCFRNDQLRLTKKDYITSCNLWNFVEPKAESKLPVERLTHFVFADQNIWLSQWPDNHYNWLTHTIVLCPVLIPQTMVPYSTTVQCPVSTAPLSNYRAVLTLTPQSITLSIHHKAVPFHHITTMSYPHTIVECLTLTTQCSTLSLYQHTVISCPSSAVQCGTKPH